MADAEKVVVRALALTGASQLIRNRATRYCGFAMQEHNGTPAAATALVYDGVSAAGTLIDVVSLAAGGSGSSYIPGGIICEKGIYVAVAGSGTIQGSIRVGD